MLLQSTHHLEEKIGNKYSLVIVAANRARMIKQGLVPLVQFVKGEDDPLTAALEEVNQGLLQAVEPPVEEIPAAAREEIDTLLFGADALGIDATDDDFDAIDDDFADEEELELDDDEVEDEVEVAVVPIKAAVVEPDPEDEPETDDDDLVAADDEDEDELEVEETAETDDLETGDEIEE